MIRKIQYLHCVCGMKNLFFFKDHPTDINFQEKASVVLAAICLLRRTISEEDN